MPGEQAAQMARVSSKIGGLVKEFFVLRAADDNLTFHAADLRAFISAFEEVAPGSPDRIMRSLRQAGDIDYVLLDRRKSLYEVRPTVARQA